MQRYNPTEIEPKWQQIWADDGRYRAIDNDTRRKYYVSGMFPYPSAAGMHVGHTFEHAIVDAVARFQRAQGANVLNPMGWDSFGLPAENYAIKTGTAPSDSTRQNIEGFTRQLKRLGASIDWSREINTSDPEYYRWTQWIFAQLYQRGLAYQKEANQWWCPVDMTVLANEQVEGGRCWRCGSEVVKKSMKQWFFKITDYADALLEEIPALDWPEKIKTAQTNWIGRSEGAEIDFRIDSDLSNNDYVFIHGYKGSYQNDFWAWLKSEVEQCSGTVYAPDLPNSYTPNVDEQVEYLLSNYDFTEKTHIVAHSLGAAVALKLLQKLKKKVSTVVLVAPCIENSYRDGKDRPELDAACDWKFEYSAIKQFSDKFVVLEDRNDYIIPAGNPQELARQLDAEYFAVTAQSGYFNNPTAPQVLDMLVDKLTVFTMRPDTIFGATFMVIAPEHPLISQLVNDGTRAAVDDYVQSALKKSEIERQSEGKEKTGVFTGSYAINPANGEKIPIWVADYVLWGYGTGAIMAVPAHDERDYQFARKFDLPITQVVAKYLTASKKSNQVVDGKEFVERTVVQCIVRHPHEDELLVLNVPEFKWTTLPMGGVEEGEDLIDAGKREVLEETGFMNLEYIGQAGQELWSEFYAEHKKVNRRAHFIGLEFKLTNLDQGEISEEEKAKHNIEWLSPDEAINKFTESEPRYFVEAALGREPSTYSGEGKLINSGKFDGTETSDAREQIVAWLEEQGLGRSKTTYKMRDWLVSRQRYWGAPIPIIHCPEHGAVAVPDDELPVLLPEVEDYAPKGESVLASVESWVNTTCPTCGGPAERETDTMDGYACSSWYLLRYTDPHNDQAAWAPDKAAYWMPLDMYIGGDHAVAHLLYVRFWNHVFYDMNLVPEKEPVKKLVYHGLIGAEDGRKMSKSLGNVVDPLEVIDQGYGADALRTFELFLGPINENSQWSSRGIAGVYRFLNRVWTLTQEFIEAEHARQGSPAEASNDLIALQHRTIKKVTTDIHRLSFNTAIAALMEYVNDLYKLKVEGFDSQSWRDAIESLVQLLAVFAPHVSAELWQQLGKGSQLDFEAWPTWSDELISTDSLTIVVQVNGKVRAKLSVDSETSEDDIKAMSLADPKVQNHLSGQPRKVIYVKDKLLSIVT